LTPGNVKIGVIKKMEMDQYHQTLNKIDLLEKSLISHISETYFVYLHFGQLELWALHNT
jgi:hypothetical protein